MAQDFVSLRQNNAHRTKKYVSHIFLDLLTEAVYSLDILFRFTHKIS